MGRLHFTRFGASAEITLYNAVLMWLLALLWKVDPMRAPDTVEQCAERAMSEYTNNSPLPPSPPHLGSRSSAAAEAAMRYASFEPLRRPGGAISMRDPAIEICRVFEWQASNHSRNREQTVLYLFPIGMALSVLKDEPRETSWLASLLAQSPVTKGYAGGGAGSGNVADFGFYVTPESLDPGSGARRVPKEHEFWTCQEAVPVGS